MYRTKSFIIIFIILLNFFKFEETLSIENKILVKINNDIITSLDIINEIKYLKSINPGINSLEESQIIDVAKNSIIRHKIKKIVVRKNFDEIFLEDKYLEVLTRGTYSSLGLKSVEDFKIYLKNNKIPFDIVRDKITIDAYWNKIIYEKFSSKIEINENDIKKRILANGNKIIDSYELYEILFNILDKERLDEKFNLINQDIKKKGFENAALIHSISDSSKKGGNMGFINAKSINQKILKEIKKLNIGEHTNPITIPGGFLILKINNIKKVEKKIDLKSEIERLKVSEMNKRLNQYSILYFNKIKKDIIINEK
jgi:peptidyl-prolyl cis-trans isomerase SurA